MKATLKIKTSLITVFVLIISLSFAHQKTAAEYYIEGNSLSDKNVLRQPEALKAYNKARILDPQNATYQFAFGKALASLDLKFEALQYLTEAIKLNPAYAEAYRERGDIYKLHYDYRAAIADYEKAVIAYKNNRTKVNNKLADWVKNDLDNLKKRKDLDRKPNSRDNSKNFKMCLLAIFLEEEWIALTPQQLYWASNRTQFSRKTTEQYTYDYSKTELNRFQTEDYFLEAKAVEYYLQKTTKNQPTQSLLDSMAFYINKKTFQNFYSAAVLLKHAQVEPFNFKQNDLLKYCSETRKNALLKMLPFISEIGKEPVNYYTSLEKFPGVDNRWEDEPKKVIIAKVKLIAFNDPNTANASCVEKLKMVGYSYKPIFLPQYGKPWDWNLVYYVLGFSCRDDRFSIMKVTDKGKYSGMTTMKIKDLRVGFKKEGALPGTNFAVCSECDGTGKGIVGVTGATYAKTATSSHFNPQYYQTSNGGKAIEGSCNHCRGNGYTYQ